jgi:hypothetical protein
LTSDLEFALTKGFEFSLTRDSGFALTWDLEFAVTWGSESAALSSGLTLTSDLASACLTAVTSWSWKGLASSTRLYASETAEEWYQDWVSCRGVDN